MKITIITVGKVKGIFSDAVDEYTKRMSRVVDILVVKQSDKQKEGKEILRLCEKRQNIMLLDERGSSLTSLQFASLVKKDMTFVIGGPDGFYDSLKEKYPSLRLSSMTMPHELALVVLVEQIYRASMIHAGRTYHRD